MKFGLEVPTVGPYGDPKLLVDLAVEAEAAGWDGFFVWDDIASDGDTPVTDPWIVLAAIAMKTERIMLGPQITPLPRRRPWKVAREAVALDQLSDGRLILGVGLGEPASIQYEPFGEAGDARVRADKLDEGLEILAGLWRGDPTSFQGEHYRLSDVQFLPTPVQRPRIPIWVAGRWPNKRPFRRAARWDGAFPTGKGLGAREMMTPDDIAQVATYVEQHRQHSTPFDLIHLGQTPGQDPAEDAGIVAPYAAAGATWWLEDCNPGRAPVDTMRARIRQGPPQ